MFFDLGIFGIHKRANFSQCWLAATDPKRFKRFVLRGDMDEIGIPTLCDEMREELAAGLMSSNHRVPLYYAAQLVYGAVRIYEQQVQNLYDKANHLFYCHNASMRELKRQRESDEISQGKKQKLPLDLAERAKEYEIDLPDISDKDVCELLCRDSQVGKPQDFLIREEERHDIMIDYDDDFGIINEEEMRNLLDVLRTEEDQSSKDIRSFSKNEKQNKVQNRSESSKDNPAEKLDNELPQEIDLIREAIREDVTMPLMLSFQDILDPNNSIQIDESTIENMRSFGAQPPLIENIDSVGGQPFGVVVPDQPGHLDDSTLAELIGPKRKRKSLKLKNDRCIKISYIDFLKQFDYIKTLRCVNPRMDVVPPYKMSFKESNRLFNMPASNLRSKELQKAFNRNLKTKATLVDAKILNDILGTESADFEQIYPVIRRSARRSACPRNDSNRRSQVDTSLAAALPPFRVTNALEITTNALETADPPDIIQMNSLLSEPKISEDDPLYLRLKEDLLKDFEREKDKQKDSNLFNSTELNRSQLGKELVIRKLVHLWKNKVEVITMKLLCNGVQRRDAALTFYCLLELSARGYVKLKRNKETNEINNIEMGVKVLNRLNGTFK